ncbi:MAG: heme-binding protein [Rhodobacteraceae bacterium]|nr:heme-binding protein [Paracoccaceae bacterium]
MLTLEIADLIADGTLAAGREKGAQPLTVVVLDAGGHVVVAKRADNSGILRIEIATGKAYGALGFGLPSRVLYARAQENANFFNAVAMASGGRLVPNPGGVLLRDTAGRIVGAVGVSGDTADMDEVCALAGIEGCGLTGDVGRG